MRALLFHTLSTFILITTLFGGTVCLAQSGQKINGISFVGGSQEVSMSQIDPLIDIESNYITLMPFAYGSSGNSKLNYQNLDWQYWGESLQGVRATAQMAQERGIDCMIKPQIWFDRGSFTGDFELNTEQEWKEFESDYTGYILPFAKLSEELHLPVFCIGTELCKFAEQRPSYWLELISKVKEIYSGKLTYASNWDSYNKMEFWQDLDYIGIDAYFPLSDAQTPTVKECQKAWEKHAKVMRSFSRKYNKQILFTEWGFRSADYCAREPWNYNENLAFNAEAQANCIAATFNEFWMKDWFAGGFIWKWFPNHEFSGKGSNNRFTPQNKPAQKVIKEWFNATRNDD